MFGTGLIFTDEPENLKAIMATKVHHTWRDPKSREMFSQQ